MRTWLVIVTAGLAAATTGSAFAQTDGPPPVTDPNAGITTEIDTSIDLENLEGEALPTTNPIAYRWEQFADNIATVFTFNAQRKATRYSTRLNRLDRKLAACAEIGDEECVQRIEERMAKLKERTDSYIAKQDELSEQFRSSYQEWRQQRDAQVSGRHLRARQLRARHEQLLEQRASRRRGIVDRVLNRQQDRQEQRDTTEEQRQQNRQELIEARSQNAADRLEAAQDSVRRHRENAADRQ